MAPWCWHQVRGCECELKSGSSTARKTRLKSKRPVSSAALRKVGSAPGSTRTLPQSHQPSISCPLFLVLFALTSVLQLDEASCQLVPVVPNNRHTIASIAGDLVVGALVPVHERPAPSQAQTRTCGNVREHYGIQRVEAAFQIIDSINADPTILPNITLGIEIRDSCWHSPIALEQAIEFIRDAMAAGDQSANPAANKLPAQQAPSLVISGVNEALTNTAATSGLYNASSCPASAVQPRRLKNIVGVVGPASSQDTVQVQNLLQLFNMPQIGYSATSRDLSNKDFFKFFLRLVPSDKLQALALIDLMLAHNWTYVTIAYTEGSYGSSLMNAFRERAQEAGICFATLESMPPNADDAKFDELIDAIQKHSNARVVVCMCEGRTVGRLFAAFKRHHISNEYLVVGSDGWSDRFDVVEKHEEFALGGISVRIHSAYLHDFDHYYFGLRPHTNHRNPWFAEFWEQRFQCNLRNYPSTVIKKTRQYELDCTGNESLRDNHKQDSKLAFVQKSILTMAMGLDNLQRATCTTPGLCQEMLPINGSLLLQHLMNVSFSYQGETVYFDQQGDPPGQYDILNFRRRKQPTEALSSGTDATAANSRQLDRSESSLDSRSLTANSQLESQVAPDSYSAPRLAAVRRRPTHAASHTNHPSGGSLADSIAVGNSSTVPSSLVAATTSSSYSASHSSKKNFEYALYATWKSSDGLLMLGGLEWLADERLAGRGAAPSSVCSLPCAKGHAKRIQSDSAKCCWVCVPCRAHEYLADQFKCQACEKGWWPNAAQTACYQIPIQYLDWRSSEALFALSIALSGLLLTLATGYIFIRHNDTPVVKSTTRELSYIILLAMLLCHACTFFLVAKPTRTTCFVSRVLPGLAFAMMYGALVTKTNRIARILAGSKKKILTRRPLFMSASAQLLITWIIVLIECSIIVIVLVRESAPDITHAYPSEARVVLVCNTTTTGIIAPLSFDFFLIAMCTWYAFKTRNVPENFNEAKFIGFTMYTTLVIWIAFVAIYLSSDHKVTALSLCISFSALFPLFLIFFPRCYIILIKPEKNNRSFFTTTKNVRCHIGYPLAAGAALSAPALPSSPCNHLSPLQLSVASYLHQQHQHQLAPFTNSSAGPTATNSLDSQQEPAEVAAYSRTTNDQQRERVSMANCCDGLARVAPVPDTPDSISTVVPGAASISREPPPNGSLWDAMCSLFVNRSRRKESDKASSIQQHLRAIRRAENLDRQTHFRRSQAQRSLQRFETARFAANMGCHLNNPNQRRASHNDQLVSAEKSHRQPRKESLDSQRLIEAFAELLGPPNVGRLAKRLAQVPEVEQKLGENSGHSVLTLLACLDELARAAGSGKRQHRAAEQQACPSAASTGPQPAPGLLCKSSSADSRLNVVEQSVASHKTDQAGRLLSGGKGEKSHSPDESKSCPNTDSLSPPPTTLAGPQCPQCPARSTEPSNKADTWQDYQDDPIGRTLERIMNPHRCCGPICTPSTVGKLFSSVGSSEGANSSSFGVAGRQSPQRPPVARPPIGSARASRQATSGAGHSGEPHKCHIGLATAATDLNKTAASSPLMSANSSPRLQVAPAPAPAPAQTPDNHSQQHAAGHRSNSRQVSGHHVRPLETAGSKQHSSHTTSNWTQKWAPATQLSVPQAPANEINAPAADKASVCQHDRQARRARRTAPCCQQPTATATTSTTGTGTDRCRRLNCHQYLTPCSHCSICRARSRSRAARQAASATEPAPSDAVRLQPEARPALTRLHQ